MLRHYTPRGKLHYATQLMGFCKATEYSNVGLSLTQYKHMNQAGHIKAHRHFSMRVRGQPE